MENDTEISNNTTQNRRSFIKTSAAATVGGAIALNAQPSFGYHHSVNDQLKVGLIGCGGRGTGAAANAANADPNVAVTALCDVFDDRIEKCKTSLERAIGDKLQVDSDHCFSGLDGYKKLIATDVDVVLLCTTPYFRPDHLEEAVAAGKHVFCEKPIATDVVGAMKVLDICNRLPMGQNMVSGLCWRYDIAVNEVMRRIKEDNAIGEIQTIEENYLTGTLWHRGNKPEWSPLENQMRNWLYYTWLSGDLIAEQHIHSLDKAVWLMDDQPPMTCYGVGGRLVRTDEKWGDVYDHFSCCFEWENGVKTFSHARQMAKCFNQTEDHVVGTRGKARVLENVIQSIDQPEWRYDSKANKNPSMYDVEHQQLFKSIRNGEQINNGQYMCYSTLMAIMGREACYTGQKIEWNEFIQSGQKLGPDTLDWDNPPEVKVKRPG